MSAAAPKQQTESIISSIERLSIADRQALEEKSLVPLRPGIGAAGKPINLVANYFKINNLPVGDVVQYDVVVNPDVPRSIKRKVFEALEDNYRKSQFGNKFVAYDGQANMFSLGKLPQDKYTLEVSFPGRPGKEDRVFSVKITKVSSVNLENLKSFLQGKLNYTPYDVITALEVILRHPLTKVNTIVGRSMYNGTNAEAISGGIEVWKGFFQSIRPSQMGMLLNVDTTATAFYSSGPVLELVRKALRANPAQPVGSLTPQEARTVERLLRGVKIEVTHRGDARRKYRVIGLTKTSCEKTMFEGENGQQQSVAHYFQSKYNIKITELNLPCLAVGSPDRAIFLPMECCAVPSGQRYPRKLDEVQTSDMIKIANQKPGRRFDMINTSSKMLEDCEGYLGAFQMSFGKDLVQVQGRVLKTPTVMYSKTSRDPECVPQYGAWNLMGKRVDTGAVIKSWAVLDFAQCHDRELHAFVEELVRTSGDAGVEFTAKNPPMISATKDIVESVKTAYTKANTQFGANSVQFVLVVLPSTDSYLYGEVKRTTDTLIGLPSQCMQVKHLRRPNKQYCANLALKINLKLGGINWSLGKQVNFVVDKPTIVLGADVTHPGIGETDKPSIAAVVASMDIKMSRYAASVRVQGSRKEIIEDMKDMAKEHLLSFQQANGILPFRILYYRDGVSEGQFAQVLDFELAAIQNAAKEIAAQSGKAYNPTVTIVLVQKRHHTRFLPRSVADADRSGNIPAGTVVDSGICHPTQFDFYLCSHAGIQGTSRPAHYHVVHDDHKFTADQLHMLSYYLCFTFARCTRSVSIVAPVYYAHLVAFRARFHFQPDQKQDITSFCPVVPRLTNRMYFI